MNELVVHVLKMIICPVTGKQLAISLAARRVMIQNTEIKLTNLEFKLLWVFVNNIGIALTHQELITKVWGAQDGASIDSLQVHVKKLRDKISRNNASWDIISIRGAGYRFDVGVLESNPA